MTAVKCTKRQSADWKRMLGGRGDSPYWRWCRRWHRWRRWRRWRRPWCWNVLKPSCDARNGAAMRLPGASLQRRMTVLDVGATMKKMPQGWTNKLKQETSLLLIPIGRWPFVTSAGVRRVNNLIAASSDTKRRLPVDCLPLPPPPEPSSGGRVVRMLNPSRFLETPTESVLERCVSSVTPDTTWFASHLHPIVR